MSRVLIVYGTRYGQTRRIAARVSQDLTSAGHAVDLYKVDELPPRVALERYGAILVAAPVFYGKHQLPVVDFIRLNCAALNAIPSALLSISGAGGKQAQQYITELITRTGWSPVLAEPVKGAIAYTRYNPILRWIMKRISRKTGLPTDTRRDHELTDWRKVERFARSVERLFPENRPERRLAEVGAGEIV